MAVTETPPETVETASAAAPSAPHPQPGGLAAVLGSGDHKVIGRLYIVAALLLSLADVSRDDIVADYAISAELISELVAEFLELSRQRGGDTVSYARMLRSPGPTMARALSSIDTEHGSLDDYLIAAGMDADQIARLRNRLTN